MTQVEREGAAASLASHLRAAGYEVDSKRRIIFARYDGRAGKLIDVGPKMLLREIVVAACIKGHYMANKGYSLPGVARVQVSPGAASRSARGRAIPDGMRYVVLERADGRCAKCGRELTDGIKLHVDHIEPFAHGGRTTLSNLQALCSQCNLGKGARRVVARGTRIRQSTRRAEDRVE